MHLLLLLLLQFQLLLFAAADITQKDLRSIFVHQQEFCRKILPTLSTDVDGNSLKQRTTHSELHCAASTKHEWHVNKRAILTSSEFQARVLLQRRRLASSQEGHVYLARINADVLATSELRAQLEHNTGIIFEDYFKSISNDHREYFQLYSSKPAELAMLENEDSIDEIIPLLPEWKLSPLLLGINLI